MTHAERPELGIRPEPDALTAAYWEAAAEHRLVLQRCQSCQKVNHPPQTLCGHCGGTRLGFVDTTGSGVIYSWTSDFRRVGAQDGQRGTVLVVAVENDPDALLVGRVEGHPDWVRIGAEVEVTFRELTVDEGDGTPGVVTLPDFVPAEAARSSVV